MAGKVGGVVNYTPTAEQAVNLNGQTQQMAAIITAWNEESEKASLAIFLPGSTSIVPVAGVIEGTEPGEFQQPSGG